MRKEDLKYEMDPTGPDIMIDEGKSNGFIALRRIRWQADKDFKIDIRRYTINADGDEHPSKGISLDTDGANGVTEGLVNLGYGDTSALLTSIKNRDDYEDALSNVNDTNGNNVNTGRDVLDRIFEES